MTQAKDWQLPQKLRPKAEDVRFDLEAAFRSVVLLRAEVPDDAYTAAVLGTERLGHGVVIRADERDYVLTIGYLITEAQSVWLTNHAGKATEAHALAYDQVSGFGLVLPFGKLDANPIALGSADGLAVGDELMVIGHGGAAHSLKVQLTARHEFAGYWEYLLDDALFTSPPHPQYAGTALVGDDGRLLGIGSLFLQETDANMFVPIDLLRPILKDMIELGRPARQSRPWLGVYTAEQSDQLLVAGLTRRGPAHSAGVKLGDGIVEVEGRRVFSLPEFYRSVWSLGAAGAEIALTLNRGGESVRVKVHSANREDFLKKPQSH
jgi:S1-C subfamily serine protease